MKEAGAVIVDQVSTGLDVFPLLDGGSKDAFARTNYYEAQFSYNLYFRRLGPNAPIRNMDELIAKGGKLVKPGIIDAYQSFNSLMANKAYTSPGSTPRRR